MRHYHVIDGGVAPRKLWNSKSAELQVELRQVRSQMERHEVASQAYQTAGLQILELAQTAYSSYVEKSGRTGAFDQTLVSNLDRGSLSPTYVKPFDVFASGSETGDWLAALDDVRNCSSRPAAPETQ